MKIKVLSVRIGYNDFFFRNKEDAFKLFDVLLETTPLKCNVERIEKVMLPDKNGWRDSDNFVTKFESMDIAIKKKEIEFVAQRKVEELKKEREKANKELLEKKKVKT